MSRNCNNTVNAIFKICCWKYSDSKEKQYSLANDVWKHIWIYESIIAFCTKRNYKMSSIIRQQFTASFWFFPSYISLDSVSPNCFKVSLNLSNNVLEEYLLFRKHLWIIFQQQENLLRSCSIFPFLFYSAHIHTK